MKSILFLFLIPLFAIPAFAQEILQENDTNQLEIQILTETMNELDTRITNIENQSSFEDQLVSSEEYTKSK